MKLSHPNSDLTIDVADALAPSYESQGWRPATVKAPAGNATLEAWQEFAREQGFSEEDPAFESRDALRAALS